MLNSNKLDDMVLAIDEEFDRRSSSSQVRQVFYVLAFGLTRIDTIECCSVNVGELGNEFRGYRADKFCYSLVTNKKWIRLYIRVPELLQDEIDPDGFVSAFPDAEIRPNGEITYNILQPSKAAQVMEYLERCVSKAV